MGKLVRRVKLIGELVSRVIPQEEPLPPLSAGFDAVGGQSGAAMAAAISAGGTLLHYGPLSGVPLSPNLERQISAVVRPFWLRSWVHSVDRSELHAATALVFEDIQSG
jgi:NADPH:quinone reductase-like Zn-dependent oxidoreductase